MVVWITGASSGIGEACAYLYATKGASLIITSTTRNKLEPVAEKCLALGAPQVKILPYDLQNPNDIESLVQEGWDSFGKVDVLYCNAGISQRTSVEDTSMEMMRKLMEINFFAPIAISKAILPKMVAYGGGNIAVTTSIAGRFGFPLRCGYSASKHALYGFFETLQAEYFDKGIHVTIVCPGRVKTNISLNSIVKGGEKYGKMDPGQESGMKSEIAAKKIVRAIENNKREVLIGNKELLMVYIKRWFPALCARLSRNIKPV